MDKLNQKEYHQALGAADRGDIAAFLKFMLRMIMAAVDELVDEITYAPKNVQERENALLKMLSDDPKLTVAEMAEVLNVSERTVKRHISSLTENGKIRRVGSDKTGRWEIV